MSTDLFSDTPTPSKPAKNRAVLIGGGALAAVAVIAGAVFGMQALNAHDKAATDAARASNAPTSALSFTGLTRAITLHDKKAALGYATGDATPALTRWIDNMETIGYTVGGIEAINPDTRTGTQTLPCKTDAATCDLTVRLGTAKPGSLTFPTTGKPDATLTTSSTYKATLALTPGQGDGYRITTLESVDHAPWDGADLEAVHGDGVTIVGVKGSTTELDKALPGAQTAARNFKVIFGTDTPTNVSGGVLRDQILFLPPDQATFSAWFARPEGRIAEADGLTFARPSLNYGDALTGTKHDGAALPGTAATGALAVTASPAHLQDSATRAGMTYDEAVAAVALHEWTHAFYYAFVPSDVLMGTTALGPLTLNACTVEGVARYTETLAPQGGNWRTATIGNLLSRGTVNFAQLDYPTSIFYKGTPAQNTGHYNGCASAFYYLATQGHDPFAAAKRAYLAQQDTITPAFPGGAADKTAWEAWARTHTG